MKTRQLLHYCVFWLLCSSITVAVWAEQPPKVVTTIKPIALIARQALGDDIELSWLQPEGQSIHQFTLRISQLGELSRADLVVGIGGAYEPAYSKALQTVAPEKLVLAADLPLSWPDPNPQKESGGDDHALHRDMHFWLDPRNAQFLADALRAHFGLPPEPLLNAKWLAELRKRFLAVENQSFVSHHDAYRHFTAAFGLGAGLAIRDSSGSARGVRSHYLLRDKARGAACVLLEPQFNTKEATLFATELHLPVVAIDPEGLDIVVSGRAYARFFEAFANSFLRCLESGE